MTSVLRILISAMLAALSEDQTASGPLGVISDSVSRSRLP